MKSGFQIHLIQNVTSEEMRPKLSRGENTTVGSISKGFNDDLEPKLKPFIGTPFYAQALEAFAECRRLSADLKESGGCEPCGVAGGWNSLGMNFDEDDKQDKKPNEWEKLIAKKCKADAKVTKLEAELLEWGAKNIRKQDKSQKSIIKGFSDDLEPKLKPFLGTPYYASALSALAMCKRTQADVNEHDGDVISNGKHGWNSFDLNFEDEPKDTSKWDKLWKKKMQADAAWTKLEAEFLSWAAKNVRKKDKSQKSIMERVMDIAKGGASPGGSGSWEAPSGRRKSWRKKKDSGKGYMYRKNPPTGTSAKTKEVKAEPKPTAKKKGSESPQQKITRLNEELKTVSPGSREEMKVLGQIKQARRQKSPGKFDVKNKRLADTGIKRSRKEKDTSKRIESPGEKIKQLNEKLKTVKPGSREEMKIFGQLKQARREKNPERFKTGKKKLAESSVDRKPNKKTERKPQAKKPEYVSPKVPPVPISTKPPVSAKPQVADKKHATAMTKELQDLKPSMKKKLLSGVGKAAAVLGSLAAAPGALTRELIGSYGGKRGKDSLASTTSEEGKIILSQGLAGQAAGQLAGYVYGALKGGGFGAAAAGAMGLVAAGPTIASVATTAVGVYVGYKIGGFLGKLAGGLGGLASGSVGIASLAAGGKIHEHAETMKALLKGLDPGSLKDPEAIKQQIINMLFEFDQDDIAMLRNFVDADGKVDKEGLKDHFEEELREYLGQHDDDNAEKSMQSGFSMVLNGVRV